MATSTRNRKRKTVAIDADNVPEVSLNAKDKFLISAFHAIVDILETKMSSREHVCNDMAVQYSGLAELPQKSVL